MVVLTPMQTVGYSKLLAPQDSLLTITVTWLNHGVVITDKHYILALFGQGGSETPTKVVAVGSSEYYRGSLVLASIIVTGQQVTDIIKTVAVLVPGTYDLYLAMYEKTIGQIPATSMEVGELFDRTTGIGKAFLDDPTKGKILGEAWFTEALEITAAVVKPTITNLSVVWS